MKTKNDGDAEEPAQRPVPGLCLRRENGLKMTSSGPLERPPRGDQMGRGWGGEGPVSRDTDLEAGGSPSPRTRTRETRASTGMHSQHGPPRRALPTIPCSWRCADAFPSQPLFRDSDRCYLSREPTPPPTFLRNSQDRERILVPARGKSLCGRSEGLPGCREVTGHSESSF